MCADKQIGGLRLFRMLGVVLLALGAAVVAFFSLPRLARDHMDRVRLSATMMGVLRWYNGTRLKRAGTERSATAILTHVGRRSGRTYETPLGAAAYGDGLVVSLAYGPGTDWCRNVMAAGTGTLAWKGQTYELERPEIISGPQVLQAWPAWERIALRAAGIEDFLWLHRKKEQGGPEQVEPLTRWRTMNRSPTLS
jgi:deazaflavin-dependent oxidoreductase (nitroreductase family)